MAIKAFPPLHSASSDGLLAIGGDLEVESLLLAYSKGIFPWPFDDAHLAWFSPPLRCILKLEKLRQGRTLTRLMKNGSFTFKRNSCFPNVIRECARSPHRHKSQGTWITGRMIEAYCRLNRLGFAESFECYFNQDLVGGVYGVRLGRFFAGESMFYLKDNASKLALLFMKECLVNEGITWIDCQVENPFLLSLGAENIPRDDFITMLDQALA